MRIASKVSAAICVAAVFSAPFAATVSAAERRLRPTVAVMIEASDLDPCSNGVVRGLNPHGDGFLSVRAAPTPKSKEIGRLYNGEQVYLCSSKGGWNGIVFARPHGNCNVMTPWIRTLPYTGPCRSGWVDARWIELYAG